LAISLDAISQVNSQTADRLATLLEAHGVQPYLDASGSAVVLPAQQILTSTNPYKSEIQLPSEPIIDGHAIVEATRSAVKWLVERETERRRDQAACEEAEREADRLERERKRTEFLEMLSDNVVQEHLVVMRRSTTDQS